MIPGLRKQAKEFLRNARNTQAYGACLQDSKAKDVQKQVTEKMTQISSSHSSLWSGLKGLLGFFIAGSLSIKLLAVSALMYFLMPMDIIPDWIVGTGYADDLMVVGVAIDQIKDLCKSA